MKKFFAFPLAAALLGFVIGCGDTATSSDEPADAPAAGTSSDTAEEDAMNPMDDSGEVTE